MSIAVTLSAVMAFGASITSAGSLYLGRQESVNWQTARDRCSCFGGQLATWSNSNDYNAIKKVRAQLGSNHGSDSWVGMHDLNTEGDWQMIDGATDYCEPHGPHKVDCDDLAEWNPGQPNNSGNEDCALIYGNGRLDDVWCGHGQFYICEFSNGQYKMASSDLEVPELPWIGHEVPQRFVYGTYSAQDLMVVALAVFLVFNVVTLAVFCLRTKGTATIRYDKVMADSDA